MMNKQVSVSYERVGTAHSMQSEVWEEVERKLGTAGSASRSAALHQAYQDNEARFAALIERVEMPAGCNGVAFAINGRLAGVDLFDKPRTLRAQLPKLIRSVALDALGEPDSPSASVTGPLPDAPLSSEALLRWFGQCTFIQVERHPSTGLGDDLRLRSADRIGACLQVDEHTIHLELFPDGGSQPYPSARSPYRDAIELSLSDIRESRNPPEPD
jgi:hypothetical protein